MDINPDALGQHDDGDDEDIHAGTPWNYCGRFDGIPGMVWYSSVRKVRGGDLRIGDALDSLDHRGARTIYGIWCGEVDPDDLTTAMPTLDAPGPDSPVRTVMFSFGDVETVRVDVEYDVVDMDTQVTPDGTPVVMPERPVSTTSEEGGSTPK